MAINNKFDMDEDMDMDRLIDYASNIGKKQWRLIIEEEPLAPEVNMAIDEAILDLQASLNTPPTLRLYMWDRPSLTIGYFQKISKEINLDKVVLAGGDSRYQLEEEAKLAANEKDDTKDSKTYIHSDKGSYLSSSNKKITVVRRITGGRSVLHQDELTYSVVMPEAYDDLPAGVTESYRYLSQGLVAALDILGIESQLSGWHNDEDKEKQENIDKTRDNHNTTSEAKDGLNKINEGESSDIKFKSAACFDTPSYYELLVQGKKIIGSAQVRRGGTILQHGSIPLASNIEDLFSVLAFPSDRVRERMRDKFASSAIAINEISNRTYTIDEIRQAMVEGFSQALGIELVRADLEAEEVIVAEKLIKEKYANDDWNLRK